MRRMVMEIKVIIVDIVVDEVTDESQHYLFKNTKVVFGILMMAHTTGGKERTETELKELLEEAGLPVFKLSKSQLYSIIDIDRIIKIVWL